MGELSDSGGLLFSLGFFLSFWPFHAAQETSGTCQIQVVFSLFVKSFCESEKANSPGLIGLENPSL